MLASNKQAKNTNAKQLPMQIDLRARLQTIGSESSVEREGRPHSEPQPARHSPGQTRPVHGIALAQVDELGVAPAGRVPLQLHIQGPPSRRAIDKCRVQTQHVHKSSSSSLVVLAEQM